MFSEKNKSLNEACENNPAFCPNGCGRSYKGSERKKSLKKHMIYTCGVNPQFTCVFCPKEFRYKNSLKYHMMSVHQHIVV